jgi:spermidine synthase
MGIISALRGERIRVGSRYFYIVRRGSRKMLKSGGILSSALGTVYSIIDTKSVFTNSYPDMFLPLPRLFAHPRVLVIGMGGGTIPYQLTKLYGDSVSIDVVEIDKEMLRMPELFLGEHRQSWKAYVGDGLEFVEKSRNRYDIIMLDAYNEDVMPPEFISDRFAKAAHSALTSNGLLAINLTTRVFLGNYSKMMKRRFSVYAYSSGAGNSLLIGSKHFGLAEIKRAAARISGQDGAGYVANVYNRIREMG